MKTKLFALTALSVLTLGVATGCNKTPSTTDVTIAAAVEWNVDEGKAMLEGQKVKINDESIVTGKHGNTIFIQQVTGDKVSNINPIEVVLASSTDAAKVAFRDWVIVEGTVTSVNGRVILTDAKLLNVEKKSSDESPIYGYNAERSFISEVGRSYSGFCGFDAVLELTSDPEELVAGTDTTLVCVYPGEPTDEDSLLTYGVEVVIPGDLSDRARGVFNAVLNGGTVTYSDNSTVTYEALAAGDQLSFGFVHLWFDNYIKFVVEDIAALNADQYIIEEYDTALSNLLSTSFTTSVNYSAMSVLYEATYENIGTNDSPVAADTPSANKAVGSYSAKYTNDAVQLDPDKDGNSGQIFANTETGIDHYVSSGSKDEGGNVTVSWDKDKSVADVAWTDIFYSLKNIVDAGYTKQFKEILGENDAPTGKYEATNVALDTLLSKITGDMYFGEEFEDMSSLYDGSMVILTDTALQLVSQWSGWIYTDAEHTSLVFVAYTAIVQVSLASIGTTVVTVPTTTAE